MGAGPLARGRPRFPGLVPARPALLAPHRLPPRRPLTAEAQLVRVLRECQARCTPATGRGTDQRRALLPGDARGHPRGATIHEPRGLHLPTRRGRQPVVEALAGRARPEWSPRRARRHRQPHMRPRRGRPAGRPDAGSATISGSSGTGCTAATTAPTGSSSSWTGAWRSSAAPASPTGGEADGPRSQPGATRWRASKGRSWPRPGRVRRELAGVLRRDPHRRQPLAAGRRRPGGEAILVKSSPADRATVSRVIFQLLIGARATHRHHHALLPARQGAPAGFVRAARTRRRMRVLCQAPLPISACAASQPAPVRANCWRAGVRIFEYLPGMPHVKALMVDGLVGRSARPTSTIAPSSTTTK